ncbi:hypothetical protein ACMXYR_02790 [Neptuniibacter sp. QD29_5]|uniref:hypothetical protein n=1 Tax=Neptuniibacter sp. QD29_5 TaxID=3398207 RepID=UPI0039F4E3E4
MNKLETLREKLGASSYGLSKYDETGAWYDFARKKVEEYEKRGYIALKASLCFVGWGGGVKHYVSKEQAHTVAKTFFREFEKLTGCRNRYTIDRVVFEHAGGSEENIHFHIVIFIPEHWDVESVIGKYNRAIIKTKTKASKADAEYKGMLGARDVHSKLDAKASMCEVAADRNGTAATLYAAHEVRQRSDSFSTEFTRLLNNK